MNKGQALLSFATGFGSGYMTEGNRQAIRDREERRDRREQERHDAVMEELRSTRQQRIALADAVAPRTAEEGTVLDTGSGREFYADPSQAAEVQDQRQAEAEMRAEQGGQPITLAAPAKGYAVRGGSKATISMDKPDLQKENSPEAKLQRTIEATMQADPAKAITLSNAVLENRKRMQQAADEAAFRRINGFKTPEEMADFMTNYPDDGMGGKFKAKVLRSADGKTWSFVGTDPDGKEIQLPGQYTNDEDGLMKARMTLAGRFADPDRRLKFYQWEQEQGEKKRHNQAMETAAQTRANRPAGGGAASSDNLTREERLRYSNLFNEAGRRLGESTRALNILQRDPLWARKAQQAGTPQAAQLAELQGTIEGYKQERELYQGLLAGSTRAGAKPPASAGSGEPGTPTAGAGGGEPKRITTKAERDALPKGARYIAPDGKTYIKQ